MRKALDFLTQLAKNNNKPWFDEHKDEYKSAKATLDALALDFMHGVEEFDPRVSGLGIKDIASRIYRDLRFSHDKSPYKTWYGAYVCPNGKKSGMAGYYIHFEPAANTYFICGGLYNPTKEVLKSVREGIMLEGDSFAIAKLKHHLARLGDVYGRQFGCSQSVGGIDVEARHGFCLRGILRRGKSNGVVRSLTVIIAARRIHECHAQHHKEIIKTFFHGFMGFMLCVNAICYVRS